MRIFQQVFDKIGNWLWNDNSKSLPCSHDWCMTGAISETGKYGTWWQNKYICSRCGATGEGPLVASLEG